jgi:hypothetical protein
LLFVVLLLSGTQAWILPQIKAGFSPQWGHWASAATRGLERPLWVSIYDEAKKDGWVVISMKNDWKRIFWFETAP